MFSQKFIFIFIFEYPLRIISELIKILVDTLIKYYTDWHGVDEDETTITSCGGAWYDNIAAGIMYRLVYVSSTSSPIDVASLKT